MEKEQHNNFQKLYDESARIGLSEDSIGYKEIMRLSLFLWSMMEFKCLSIEDPDEYDQRAYEFDLWYDKDDIDHSGLILRPIRFPNSTTKLVVSFTILSWSSEDSLWIVRKSKPNQRWVGMLLETDENGEESRTFLKDNQVPSELSMDYKLDNRNNFEDDEPLLLDTDQLHNHIRELYVV